MKILRETHHFFKCALSFLCQFLLFSSSTPLPKWRTCWMVPIKIHNIVMGCILRDAEIILLFNTSWLASLRTWCLALDFYKLHLFRLWAHVNYKEPHIKLLFAFTKAHIKNKNLQSRCWWLWLLNLLLKGQIQKILSTFCHLRLVQ